MSKAAVALASAAGNAGGERLYVEDVFSTYLFTGNGTSQTIGNGIALGDGASSPGWIATLGGTGIDYGTGITLDSSGNIYVSGYADPSGAGDKYLLIAKYNSSGTIQWQRTLGGTSIDTGEWITVDSSGNIYVTGYTSSSGSGSYDLLIVKYNSSGTIQWQRTLGGTGSDYGAGITVDSSGNIYVIGYTSSTGAGSTDFLIAKYNSSGTIQWQRTLGGTGSDYGRSITVDSSDNVYVVGRENSTGAGSYDVLIAKYNSSGTIQWQRTLGGTGADLGYGITVDSSGNIYVVGNTASTGAGSYDAIIAKYNSSGTIQWQRTLGGSVSETGYGITVDSSGNIYVVGNASSSGAGSIDVFIAKYNSSGTIQWQRTLGGTGADEGYGITVDNSGNVYVVGVTTSTGAGAFDCLIAKLPSDGSGVGTYGPFTYAASSLTDAASSLTSATSSLTDAAASLTDAASSLTDASASLTSSLTEVPVIVGEGGMVWIKSRGAATFPDHRVYDTERGATNSLITNQTVDNTPLSEGLTSFISNGFTHGNQSRGNQSGITYTSWTFRKAPKFFDVVTWSGNSTAGREIAHNLGSTPGFIIVKNLSYSVNWHCWHRGCSPGYYLQLNLPDSQTNASSQYIFGNGSTYVDPTDTVFTVGGGTALNQSGFNYVAYLFAHNAGGFGDDGTENVISCGSYTTDGSGNSTVNLGYEPQWFLTKSIAVAGSWLVADNMRGLPADGSWNLLFPNSSSAEGLSGNVTLTATGINLGKSGNYSGLSPNTTYIYIAIRRGPMKTPTSGTEVYEPDLSPNSNNPRFISGFPVDMATERSRISTGVAGMDITSRLTHLKYMRTGSTIAEASSSTISMDYMNGFDNDGDTSPNWVAHMFRRAPGFFDVVAYTGTGVAHAETHNLGVAPEMMIVKKRSDNGSWCVYHQGVAVDPETDYLFLESTAAVSDSTTFWNDTAPTNTNFTVGTYTGVNLTSETFIAYLFATLAGVSKVGSYTGTGTTNQIDCGFSSGARFVLIKRADSTGDWYVYDSARGIVAGNDPYLLLNSTAAEVTSTDYIDPYSAGFEISSSAPAAINASGGTYIYLAIA